MEVFTGSNLQLENVLFAFRGYLLEMRYGISNCNSGWVLVDSTYSVAFPKNIFGYPVDRFNKIILCYAFPVHKEDTRYDSCAHDYQSIGHLINDLLA